MSHKKWNKSIANKQEITDADIKITKSQQKQRITKRQQSPSIEHEEQLIYTELKCHRTTSQVQHRKWAATGNRKGTVLHIFCKCQSLLLGVYPLNTCNGYFEYQVTHWESPKKRVLLRNFLIRLGFEYVCEWWSWVPCWCGMTQPEVGAISGLWPQNISFSELKACMCSFLSGLDYGCD